MQSNIVIYSNLKQKKQKKMMRTLSLYEEEKCPLQILLQYQKERERLQRERKHSIHTYCQVKKIRKSYEKLMKITKKK